MPRTAATCDTTARLQALWTQAGELIRQTEARLRMEGDLKVCFVQRSREEMVTARQLLQQDLPDIDTRTYYDKAKSIREERVKKSKEAGDALIMYTATLTGTGDTAISQFNVRVALMAIGRLQLLHKEKKMTLSAVQKELKAIPLTLDPNKYRKTFEALVRHGGDWRVGHDPMCPSISGTYFTMQKLLKGEVGDP